LKLSFVYKTANESLLLMGLDEIIGTSLALWKWQSQSRH